MTYKHIEASREARLWIGQVIVPAVTLVALAMTNEKLREKASDCKTKFTAKFLKK